MTEDDIRKLLRDMREEPLPPESLRRVRLGVAERTAKQSRFGWWGMALFAAAAMACLLIMLNVRSRRPVAKPSGSSPAVVAVAPAPEPAAKPEPRTIAQPAVRQQIRPAFRAATRVERPKPPVSDGVVIRIETPDPDVVILLIAD
jgi:hypothetical protein